MAFASQQWFSECAVQDDRNMFHRLYSLVDKDVRNKFKEMKASVEEMYEHIYWKQGATELATGKKTLTLKQFEKNIQRQFIHLARGLQG